MKKKWYLVLLVLLLALNFACSLESLITPEDDDATTPSNENATVDNTNTAAGIIIPIAKDNPQVWKYTTTDPGSTWFEASFDDSSWSEGKSGFGTSETPGATVNTPWNSGDIWIRKTFNLEALPQNPSLNIRHDEDTKVYINGVLVWSATGFIADYQSQGIDKASFKVGQNVVAVYCHQTFGGQYIDVGLEDKDVNVTVTGDNPTTDQTTDPTTDSTTGDTVSNEKFSAMVEEHNKYRLEKHTSTVVWDNGIAAYAQEWADYLKQNQNCQMSHRSHLGMNTKSYGENLAWAWGQQLTSANVVKMWWDEVKDYSYADNSCSGVCGHYTQVMWKDSKKIGCGYASCSDSSEVWVCNYDPPGNYIGQKPY